MSHRFKKRERTQNWSPEEKILLLKLCEDRLDVLESKRGDQISIAKKGNAWKEIRQEFVAALGIERDVSRLKEQWQRMKCQARADLQDFAMRLKKFGPEIANQKRPNQMSAEVWRVMESARKYFLHMNGTESEEDASTKEINWSLSEVNAEVDTGASLLCETEVRTNPDDNIDATNGINIDATNEMNYFYPYQQFNLLAECPSPGGLPEQAKLDFYAKREFVLSALANAQQQRQLDSPSPNIIPDTPEEHDEVIQSLAVFFESKKIEQHKKLQLMDEQVKTAKIHRETAELQKQIAQQQLKQAIMNFSKVRTNKDEDDYGEDNRKRLKEDIKEKLVFHEEQIRLHQEAINRHKQRLLDFE